MAISSIGAIAYANQAMPAQTKMQSNFQNRLDMQSGAATAIQDADKQEVEEIRPTEETYKIDPEHEHEKRRSNKEEQEGDEESQKSDSEVLDDELKEAVVTKHLDIKV